MREPGFYWVRFTRWSGDPQVARWDGEMWWQDGDDRAYCPEYDEGTFEVLSVRLGAPGELPPNFELVKPPGQTPRPGQPR